MKNVFLVTFLTLGLVGISYSQVGINTDEPTNMLHIKGEAGEDPLRVEELQVADNDIIGSLVTDNTGVIKLQNSSSISAVRVTGSVVLAINNTLYNTDQTSAPTETFDNLNEFSGNTFTASQTGLYQINYSAAFNQRSSTNDNGDGYIGSTRINLNGSSYASTSVKVTLAEAGGGAARNTCNNSTLIKLTSGDNVQFQVSSFGSTGGVSGNYDINIERID